MLYPKEYHKNVLSINLEKLWHKGIRLILLDLDNTLIEWKREKADKRIFSWLRSAEKKGFHLCIVSNNTSTKRVEKAATHLKLPFICRAKKPLVGGLFKVMKKYGFKAPETCMIGDQIFTDVLGGNRSELYTILVKPLCNRDFWATTLFTRNVEKIVLWRMKDKVKMVSMDAAAN